ncbi:Nitrogen regulation protein NtrX [hydrothermal vent metagenome]|uniref:Nitrogen regulation protein NtrX n=1 Tax=hydrothermal vent metagenome TaxID=652676 RepID=A0A3B0T176_9ZZZZ
MSADILIVDDEEDIRELVSGILEDEGFQTRVAADATQALTAVQTRKPALVILDVWLHGSELDGLGVLEELKRLDEKLPVILISGHGTIETAVAAIRKGAFDFIEKPFKSERLLLLVRRALELRKLQRENTVLKARNVTTLDLIGVSQGINGIRQVIQKVAMANSRVLVLGGLGAGKETVARKIHLQSHRKNAEFVVINAATLDPDSVEKELFGVEDDRGRTTKTGLFEQAHMGTLYIDEVAEMPLQTQGKLLRILVGQRFRRVGGQSPVSVDVRVISSSSRNLPAEVAKGLFREDLYHRLNVVPVTVPSLNERREDIPELVRFFANRISQGSGLARREIGEDVMGWMQAAQWPGNVRQLRNYVEKLMILAKGNPGETITLQMMPEEGEGTSDKNGISVERLVSLSLREARVEFEREYLAVQISRFGGNISRTAAYIGMERSALHRKLKTLGIGSQRGRNEPEEPQS